MRLFSLPQLIIGVALVAALTFFSSQARVDEQELRLVEQRLHRFARLDAELNQGLVLVRQGLVNDYDGLVASLRGMEQLVQSLRDGDEGGNDPAIDAAIDALAADVKEKGAAIERFKSDVAVFKNSLAYFPTIIDDVGEGLSAWWVHAPSLAESVHRLFRAVLAYAQPGGLLGRDEVEGMVRQLEEDRAGAPEAVRPLLANALRHARFIVERKERIERLVKRVLQVPTAEHGRQLLGAHSSRFGERLRVADVYRQFLYLGSVALVLLIAYALFRLRKSAREMQILNRELSREVAVRRMVEAEQRRLAMAVEASPDGVLITDPDGTIVYVNPAFSEITGWAADEAQGHTPRILRSGRMERAYYDELWSAIGRGEVWKGRFLNRRRGERGEDGLYWAQTTIAPIHRGDGALDGFVGVQVDITDEVRREEGARFERSAADLLATIGRTLQEMRPLAERLDEALRALHDIERLPLTGDAVLLLDPAVAEVLGAELDGASRYRVEPIQGPAAGALSVIVEEGEPVAYRLPLVQAGGRVGCLRLPLKGEADRDAPVLELLRRVGESIGTALANERARADMDRARVAAEAASRLKSDFLATMSHEIRTPMNAIIGMGELLMESPLDDEQRQYIRTLRGAGETLLYIIDDILDLSKVEAGRMTLVEKPFFLGEVVGHIGGMMEGQARSKGLELEVSLPDEGPTALLGDPGRLQQVLFNLVGNAVKFTEAGSVALRVAASGEKEGRLEYHFQVEDTGHGVPTEMREAIFERFTQADTSVTRRHGGTGLGLAISQRLVALMGGRIWLESEEGRGSTFHFTACFPRAQQPATRATQPVVAEPVVEPARPRRLLLVEDSPDNRTLILLYLKGGPYEVECAENGLEALEKFRDRRFDLVLMDMQMPIMDGYSATREIRRWEREGDHLPTPVVALTAHALKGDDDKSLEAGCDDHLTKPIKKRVLLEALERHLSAA